MKVHSPINNLIVFLLVVIACKISAQTNLSSFEVERLNKTFDERLRSRMREEQPVRPMIRIEQMAPDRPISCWIGVMGHTNIIAYQPLPEQAFDAHLFDSTGKEIPKTWFNNKFGKKPKPDKELLDGSFA